MAHRYPVNEPLSLAHLSELDLPPQRLLRAAAAAGFASVGFRTAPASPGGITYPLATPAEQAEIRAIAADTGCEVLYIEMLTLGDGFDADFAKRILDNGAAIGATRLGVSGDSPDIAAVAARMATVCDLAAPLGIAVDLEFMPFRPVASLADGVEVVRRADKANAHLMVDALHMHRSHSTAAALAAVPPALIGTYQICDAPTAPPDDLPTEARKNRLLPGAGDIDITAQIAALPPATPLGVEVPLAAARPDLSPEQRLALLVTATRDFLTKETIR